MRVPLFHLVVVGMVVCAPVTAGETRPIPACMVIDDPAPFINMRWVKDKTVCREIPTSFYQELGQWAKRVGVKGKFSVIPCLGGVKPIDGSLGEYPDHSRQERLEWIAMVKTLFAPRFTITPEVITHWYVWDVANRKLLPGPQTENQWLPLQPVETQTQYIAAAMKMLRDVGLEPGGLTMCWSYPTEKEALLGQATLEAAERVCGLKYVMVFNEPGDRPQVIYRRADGAMAVSLRPLVEDVYDHTFGKKTEADIRHDADRYITADGTSGWFVEKIKKDGCLIFCTHAQTLYGNGTKSGWKVFQIAIERLHKHYGDRIRWMTGLEVCRHFCPPEAKVEVSAPANRSHFRLAIAEPLRHKRLEEIAADVTRYRGKGYNAVFFENDYLRWSFLSDADAGFGGNWRMFNLFDFTRSRDRQQCRDYLRRLCRMCGDARLDVYPSFWLPQLTTEFRQYLRSQQPDAIGRTTVGGQVFETVCTCKDGKGLEVLGGLIEELMRDFPEIRGLKVATLDNSALLCDEHCPHAHGTTQAEHAANLFACVEEAMRRVRPDSQFLVYPWFWKPGFKDVVLPRLKEPYYVIARYSQGARQQIEPGIPGEPLFDASLVLPDTMGPEFADWLKRVGPEHVLDMVPVGTGLDCLFLAAPPNPVGVYRRLQALASHQQFPLKVKVA